VPARYELRCKPLTDSLVRTNPADDGHEANLSLSLKRGSTETGSSLTLGPSVIISERKRNRSTPRSGEVQNFKEISPIEDVRWTELVNRHRDASLFHSKAWLTALRDTYNYDPVVFTTTSSAEGPLANGFVFCRVKSWLTGQRLVSLPFSDYCELLCRGDEDPNAFLAALEGEIRTRGWRYIELRPVLSTEKIGCSFKPFVTYTLHRLDLRPDLSRLFANFHKSSIQRKIRRSEREGLAYSESSCESLLEPFYRLLVLSRRRHCVPPQPRKWFRNLIECFGSDLKIRIASKNGRAISAMLTIRHKDVMYYKYGGSDERFHRFGGMHFLYWQTIQDAKHAGLRVFDLGRTDMDQPGLITFKSRWGAPVSAVTYYRIALSGNPAHVFEPGTHERSKRALKALFAYTPPKLLSGLGAVLYKHVG